MIIERDIMPHDSQESSLEKHDDTPALVEELKAALRSSEAKNRAILEALPDLIFQVNRDGVYLACHANSEDELLFPLQQFLGKSMRELDLPREFVEQSLVMIQQTLHTQHLQTFEYQMDVKGRLQYHEARLMPLYDDEVLVIIRDITERRQTEERLREHQTTLETTLAASPVGIGLIRNRLLHWANDAMYRMLGYEQGYFPGKSARILYESDDEYERVGRELYKDIQICGCGQIETRWKRKDGTLFDCELRARSLDLVDPSKGQITAAMDITPRKQIETELRRAKEAAEAANQAKSMFLANMNHELRTPLNIILGYAQILQKKDVIDQDVRDGLTTILQSGQHLLLLIKDLLDLSRMGTQQIALFPHELYLPAFLYKLAEIISIQAREKNIEFRYDAAPQLPAIIYIDEIRLRQVLLNLLNNAVRFTRRGAVTLRMTQRDFRALEAPGSSSCKAMVCLRFEVEDTGIGMAADQLTRIFLPFEQLRKAEQWHPGTGAGLAISRHLVRLMGGELCVTSEPGKGSLFWFDLTVSMCGGMIRQTSPEIATLLTTDDDAPHADIVPPPPDDLAQLRKMAVLGLMDRVGDYVEQLAERDRMTYLPFVSQVKQFVRNVDDEKLLKFLEQYITHDQ